MPRLVTTRVVRAASLTTFLTVAIFFTSAGPVAAQGEEIQELADRYAPIMMVKAQEEECDSDGESFAPTEVDLVLGNPQILLRQTGTADPVIMIGPDASDLFGLGEGFHLDFPGEALHPGCLYERDFRRYADGRRPVVYAHVATQDDTPDMLALQYWFYWYFNDWNDKHESDWEGIQLLFDVGSVAEALQVDPISIGYAQHLGGERADWSDDEDLQRRGTRPIVYSAAGSHPSHFQQALFLGRRGSQGFGCDSTVGPSLALDPEVVVLPDVVEDANDPLAWLEFEGRWGERQSGSFNAPTGPKQKDRWTAPVDWHNRLRTSSVVVPAGSGLSQTLINDFCGIVEWGSAQLITIRQNPLAVLVVTFGAVALVIAALRRTDWAAVAPLPIVRRRRAGQILRAAARLYRADIWMFVKAGFLYLPVSFVLGIVVSLIQRIPLVGALVTSDDGFGLVSLSVTLVLGGLGHSIALVIVTAAVASLMVELENGADRRELAVYGRIRAAVVGVLPALGRAVLVVSGLLLSVVGAPWGIRQLIRYQFLAETTTIEGRRSPDALDRSADLVSGRWFHTIGFVLLLQVGVMAAAGFVGLLLLTALASVPLWFFSVLVTGGLAIVAPYVSIAIVLLYGDARAESEELGRAELVGATKAS